MTARSASERSARAKVLARSAPSRHVIELGPIELRAVDREERLPLADLLAGVIDEQLLDPAFGPDVDVERLGLVGSYDPNCADTHVERSPLDLTDRNPDALLDIGGDFDLRVSLDARAAPTSSIPPISIPGMPPMESPSGRSTLLLSALRCTRSSTDANQPRPWAYQRPPATAATAASPANQVAHRTRGRAMMTLSACCQVDACPVG